MSAIRSTGNQTEIALRKRLHALGLRYRVYVKGLAGRPDIVFLGPRVVVFVDGDYWHCRVLVEEGIDALQARLRTPSRDYWLAKFQRRVIRDLEVTQQLCDEGWLVVRLWESDVKRDIDKTARTIAAVVRRRRRKVRER